MATNCCGLTFLQTQLIYGGGSEPEPPACSDYTLEWVVFNSVYYKYTILIIRFHEHRNWSCLRL